MTKSLPGVTAPPAVLTDLSDSRPVTAMTKMPPQRRLASGFEFLGMLGGDLVDRNLFQAYLDRGRLETGEHGP